MVSFNLVSSTLITFHDVIIRGFMANYGSCKVKSKSTLIFYFFQAWLNVLTNKLGGREQKHKSLQFFQQIPI